MGLKTSLDGCSGSWYLILSVPSFVKKVLTSITCYVDSAEPLWRMSLVVAIGHGRGWSQLFGVICQYLAKSGTER